MKKYVTFEITLEEVYEETEVTLNYLSITDYFKWNNGYYLILNKTKCADETYEIEAIRLDKEDTVDSFRGDIKVIACLRREIKFE